MGRQLSTFELHPIGINCGVKARLPTYKSAETFLTDRHYALDYWNRASACLMRFGISCWAVSTPKWHNAIACLNLPCGAISLDMTISVIISLGETINHYNLLMKANLERRVPIGTLQIMADWPARSMF